MAVSSGERLIGVEWVLVTLLQAGDAIASGGQTTTNAQGVSTTAPKLPSPSRFFAAMIAYLMLAGAAMFGPNAAKVASRLGAVAALAIALAPPVSPKIKPIGPGNQPLIIRFLNLLNSYLLAGAVSQPGQAPAPINPNTLVPSNPGPGGTGSGAGGLGLGSTILGPGVLGGVSSSDAESGSSPYTPGGPTQQYTHPIGSGGVA